MALTFKEKEKPPEEIVKPKITPILYHESDTVLRIGQNCHAESEGTFSTPARAQQNNGLSDSLDNYRANREEWPNRFLEYTKNLKGKRNV